MTDSVLLGVPTKYTTPLRYPGGKGKLAAFIKATVEENDLLDGHYVEPYAGGAAVALELLLHEYVRHIHINDISKPIFSFWKSVLVHTEQLCRKIRDAKLSVQNWDRQKAVIENAEEQDDLDLGFALFFLNRTNRSGILNGGIIGGRDQTGPWKIDARYNAPELIKRIEAIARLQNRIELTREDAYNLIKRLKASLPPKSLFYLDPPYYVKGKELYLNFYFHKDHLQIAKLVRSIHKQKWIVSYDNATEIRQLYRGCPSVTYGLRYSARESREGTEVMFFSESISVPEATRSMIKPRRTKVSDIKAMVPPCG